MNDLVPLYASPCEDKNAEVPVPLGRIHFASGSPVPAEKPMIGNEHDMRLWPRQFDQPAQHLIVKFVNGGHHISENFMKFRPHVCHPRRLKCHEVVADVINCFVIRGAKIPRLFLHQCGRDCMQ